MIVELPAKAHAAGALSVRGMHGLGDNIHQRGIVRQLMEIAPVWLETSWPWIYHDLVGERLHLVRKGAPAEIYARNAMREASAFSPLPVPVDAWRTKINYRPSDVRAAGSVLGGMCRRLALPLIGADFRLPIASAWAAAADALIQQWQPTKPLMIYRPLVERSWWQGCLTRNPDHAAYAALYREIRKRYFVVSVAELVAGEEWLVGEPADVDVTAHAGEIPPPVLAALVARAQLVYTSPGFAVILAQAVGTPSVAVFGGYEDGRSFSAGARFAPHLAIEPITPCACFSHQHACDKRIDLDRALPPLQDFAAMSEGWQR